MDRNIFAADLRLFAVLYPVATTSQISPVPSPTIPLSAARSEVVILSDLICPSFVQTEAKL